MVLEIPKNKEKFSKININNRFMKREKILIVFKYSYIFLKNNLTQRNRSFKFYHLNSFISFSFTFRFIISHQTKVTEKVQKIHKLRG